MVFKALSKFRSINIRKYIFVGLVSARIRLRLIGFNNRDCKDFTSKVYAPRWSKTSTMPKRSSQRSAKHTDDQKKISAADGIKGPVWMSKDGDIFITVQAKPGAKHNNITEILADSVGVQISAPLKDGEANEELTKYLASIFEVKKSTVSLQRGTKSRFKTVLITGSGLTFENAMQFLNNEVVT